MSSSNTRPPGVTYVYHGYILLMTEINSVGDFVSVDYFYHSISERDCPRFRYFMYWVLISKVLKSSTRKRLVDSFFLEKSKLKKRFHILVTFFTASCSPGPLLH